MKLLLLTDRDIQKAFAAHLRKLREQAKLSREDLATRSTVPSATIKKFELTGQISFRQLLLLWQTLDDLNRLYALTRKAPEKLLTPKSIEEVLKDGF
ncbi:helix-turn-helix transcriptional regulator [Chromatiaceae bacterium AAb-1]|nr:helix-turn-helix transcriptional regulator [Chromatiaceae bacterium AAb-1]